jgi:IclR family transcriptional regulator, pca regulon regulatory protein
MSATIQSLARGLSVLRLFAGSSQGMPLREVAALTGLKRPAMHKILSTLVESGFLEKTEAPVIYRLGDAAFEMGRVARECQLQQCAEQVIVELACRLPDATVTVARSMGGEVMTFLRVSPRLKGFVERPVDSAMNAYGSPASLLFQAYWTPEKCAAYRDHHCLSDFGGHTWKSLAEVDAFLSEVRRTGYCSPSGVPGRFRVAAPIFDAGERIVATLAARMEMTSKDACEETVDVICDAAKRISGALKG